MRGPQVRFCERRGGVTRCAYSTGAPEERRDGRGRWSAKRKAAAILRLLRGEDLETLSRELGVTAATLSGWRDQFLDGGEANLRAREADVENEETQRLKSLVADLSMSNELLREKIHRMEAGRPLAWRRSKP
ncbi:MAG: IS3 family transposase [Acidobacteria bacterium]|nr:MAG: IS3 family transposase [Acidobacteriota bacterium]